MAPLPDREEQPAVGVSVALGSREQRRRTPVTMPPLPPTGGGAYAAECVPLLRLPLRLRLRSRLLDPAPLSYWTSGSAASPPDPLLWLGALLPPPPSVKKVLAACGLRLTANNGPHPSITPALQLLFFCAFCATCMCGVNSNLNWRCEFSTSLCAEGAMNERGHPRISISIS